MSGNSSPIFDRHNRKVLLCQLMKISQLKSNIFSQLEYSGLHHNSNISYAV
jgi:hypothetical protein